MNEPPVLGPDDVRSIRAAVERVLGEPAYRARAQSLADEVRTTATAAELLAALEP